MKALKDVNENPINIVRGNPENPAMVKEYLENVLAFPEGREVKAFNRKPYSPENKKTLFMHHSFYVFLKDGKIEHSLVFTATPKGSEQKGNWMLDAESDIDSYKMFINSNNPWQVEEYQTSKYGSRLNLEGTTKNILKRLEKEYSFFGPASVRDLPWYHFLWLTVTPPPILTLGSILIVSIHKDNCNSAVLETMVWDKPEVI
ncbi:MAG: hypothetical protein WC162_01730 [Sphaerochaetaceae bacterium]